MANLNGFLKHYNNWTTFSELKVSADKNNNTYKINNSGSAIYGTPDILWDDIVFIENEAYIWTHGKLYHDTSKIDKSEFDSAYTYINSRINTIQNDLNSYVTQSSLSSNSYAGYAYVYSSYEYLKDKINEVHDQTYFYVAQGIEEMDDTLSSIDQRTYNTVYSYTQGLDLIYAAAIDEVRQFDLTYALVLEELTARVEALENNS